MIIESYFHFRYCFRILLATGAVRDDEWRASRFRREQRIAELWKRVRRRAFFVRVLGVFASLDITVWGVLLNCWFSAGNHVVSLFLAEWCWVLRCFCGIWLECIRYLGIFVARSKL